MQTSQIMHKIIKDSLIYGKKYIFIIFLSIIVLSISQSLFFLIIRPFLSIFFEDFQNSGLVFVKDFLNPRVLGFVPEAVQSYSIKKSELPYYVQSTLFVLVVTKNLASYFYVLNIAALNGIFIRYYRDFLFKSIVNQSYKNFCQKTSSAWMSVIMNDVFYLQNRSYEIMNSFLKDFSLIISAFLVMFLMNYKLAFFMLIILPLFSYLLSKFSVKISCLVDLMQLEISNITNCFNHMCKRLDEIWVTKSIGLELEKFNIYCERYFYVAKKLALRRSLIAPLAEVAGYAIFVSVFFLNTTYGFFHTGDSLVFFISLGVAIKPLKSIGEQITRVYEIKGSLSSTHFINEKTDQKSSEFFVEGIDSVDIARASFKWQNSPEIVLQDLSLSSGDIVVITGASGSGKTTIMKGLSGLISPLEWSSALSWEKFSRNTVLLPQFSYVFQGSILDNIYYGSEEKKTQKKFLSEYLDVFGLQGDFNCLEKGLDTPISAFAERMSGGQIQRLVLLRSLMRNKKILLLDEFSSSLDENLEFIICSHLVKIVKEQGFILVAITHRNKIRSLANKVYNMSGRTLKACSSV
jgi:ATP-binding cassette, subfamily B, bacterial MsbA